MQHLSTLWFVIVAVFWIGFFVLEGFDFGVGMLHSFIGHNDAERRVAVNSIGPFWDGNEVWLIVAGAAMFAAFPLWYATMFSAFYLALAVLLLAMMFRGVSFEYGRKVKDHRWYQTWRWSLTIGSAVIPLLIGVALGDLLHGLPIDSSHQYTAGFWNLLVPYGVYTGITLVSLCLLMGSTFLALKTTDELRERASRYAVVFGWISLVLVWGFVTWTHVGLGYGFVPNPIEVIAVLAVIAAAFLSQAKSEGWAFLAAAVGIASTVGTIFTQLYPRVMVSSTNHAYNLTVANTASPSYSLKVMTVVAVIFFPVVLVYQAWGYHIFKRRLTAPPVAAVEAAPISDTVGAGAGEPPTTSRAGADLHRPEPGPD